MAINFRPTQSRFQSFSGIVTDVSDRDANGCQRMIQLQNNNGEIVNFVAGPDTYFVDQEKIYTGMYVIGYYDANLPAILIFPPQFNALVMGVLSPGQSIKVSSFDRNLVSQDGTLRLNLSSQTDIKLENGQDFWGSLTGRDLIVVYGATTRSIPAQTTPSQIIVMCPRD